MTDSFSAFCSEIGQEVSLRCFDGYNGGLDVEMDMTGTISYAAEHRGCEIMYHVGPLLPFSESDQQQLRRKRHIGNDITSIIFLENGTDFDPNIIDSHFTHVIIVISPLQQQQHKVRVFCKKTVSSFRPPLPQDGIFYSLESLRIFLLDKAINGQIYTYRSPSFIQRFQTTLTSTLKFLNSKCFGIMCQPDMLLTMDTIKRKSSLGSVIDMGPSEMQMIELLLQEKEAKKINQNSVNADPCYVGKKEFAHTAMKITGPLDMEQLRHVSLYGPFNVGPLLTPRRMLFEELSEGVKIFYVIRRLGCPVCRTTAMLLSSTRTLLKEFGVDLIGITWQSSSELENFCESGFFEGPIYTDEQSFVYNCLKKKNVFTSLKDMGQLSEKFLRQLKKTKGNLLLGISQFGSGFFVLKDKILEYQNIWSDEPNIEQLFAALDLPHSQTQQLIEAADTFFSQDNL
eukprot:Lithocolla_globosa_v1_NODE_2176_length_2126_cov_3.893720.p1 type:complete len:455 gc:universal NODE_2176_length_2126_cov_3.893720:2008-644(-)